MQLCRAYKILEGKLLKNKINELEDIVANELISFGCACKAGDKISMGNLLEAFLIPAVKAYRSELAAFFNPYILC